MKEKQESIQASILDRLIDREPQLSSESVQYRLLNFSQVKAAVIRDLENLLNTKSQIMSVPAAYKEVNGSVFVYGLSDFTSHNPKSPSVRQVLRQNMEKTIMKFEPRLKNVNVQIEAPNEEVRTIRLRISALLVLDPVVEPVTFDTYFDINRGEYTIRR
ncbi:MAG TPA: type VI secretion system baseplate subunit TssE [Syntrophorhabdales bacterium]|nr:type VI secretion system baseplate subunit TssE [Syntrophorhabdales bacterium]